jgi:hypothetical protein
MKPRNRAQHAVARWLMVAGIALALSSAGYARAATPELVLTPQNPVVDLDGSTMLSWSAVGVSSCTASGAWSGDMPVSGTVTVGPLSRKSTYTLACTGTNGSVTAMVGVQVIDKVLVSWIAPSTRVDGTEYTSPDGFRLYYGTSPGHYTNSIRIWKAEASKRSLLLTSDTYYFAVTAVDLDGLESPYSNEVVRVVK